MRPRDADCRSSGRPGAWADTPPRMCSRSLLTPVAPNTLASLQLRLSLRRQPICLSTNDYFKHPTAATGLQNNCYPLVFCYGGCISLGTRPPTAPSACVASQTGRIARMRPPRHSAPDETALLGRPWLPPPPIWTLLAVISEVHRATLNLMRWSSTSRSKDSLAAANLTACLRLHHSFLRAAAARPVPWLTAWLRPWGCLRVHWGWRN